MGVFNSWNNLSYNRRAISSYEKVGFQHEGRRRETIYRDGVYYDDLIMSILRREWEALNQPANPAAK